MQLMRRLMGGMLLLSLATILASCITINPGAIPRLPSTPSPGADNPDAFVADMIAAIVTRNDAALQAMMGSPFAWASWQGTAEEMAPADAIVRMQNELVQNAMSLTFVAPPVINDWMRGVDPLSIWPEGVEPAAVIGVGGLGQEGLDEAILVIAQYPDGTYYWYGLLAAPGGFASQSGDPPTAIVVAPVTPPGTPQMNILPTNVQQVLVLGAVGIFAEPSGLSNQVGTTVRGQTFAVLGVSADGQWWAIPCPATPGTCWISANPTFVRPVSGNQPVVTATATVVYPTHAPYTAPTDTRATDACATDACAAARADSVCARPGTRRTQWPAVGEHCPAVCLLCCGRADTYRTL